MPDLIDFVPVEAALWLEPLLYRAGTIRIDGPPGSGKTQLLTTFADTVGDSVAMHGLSETQAGLHCLRNRPRATSWCMPALVVRGRFHATATATATAMVLRQNVGIVVVDDPSDETWALLPDLARLITVWAASTDGGRQLEADISIRLGNDPLNRVELITVHERPVYWLSNGEPTFRPDEP